MEKSEKFVIKPNIPENTVSLMIVSGEFPEIYQSLTKYTAVEKSSLYIKFRKAEAYHPDMQVNYLGSGKIVCADNCGMKERLKNIGLTVIEHQFGNTNEIAYPSNIALNCMILGEYVVGKLSGTSQIIKNWCEEHGYKFINVKQGYTKCSVAIVDESSVITADESIYNALYNKIDVLKIRPGYIQLPGCNYGFIGGCCGLIDKNVLAFSGDIKKHPDANKIIDFLKARNIEYVNLTDNELLDVGSIIPIKERI